MAGLIIAPRARIFHGHEWVYATEVKKTFGDPQPGDVITLKDFQDRSLGTAIYNPISQIVARRFSRRKQDLDAEFFVRRIAQSIEYRQRVPHIPGVGKLLGMTQDELACLAIHRRVRV